MKYCSRLVSIFLFAAAAAILSSGSIAQTTSGVASTAPPQERSVVDSIAEYLLTSAAADFRAHGPSGPLRFRDVRLGHSLSPGAEMNYLLCGQFMRAQDGTASPWTPFVTIKTSGYEQYIGNHAAEFCKDSTVVWDREGDLTSLLQSRFDEHR